MTLNRCFTQNIDMDGFSFDVHTLCCLQCIEFQGRLREGTGKPRCQFQGRLREGTGKPRCQFQGRLREGTGKPRCQFQGRLREGTGKPRCQYCVGMTCNMSSPCHPSTADEAGHRVGWNASCEMGGLHPGLYRF